MRRYGDEVTGIAKLAPRAVETIERMGIVKHPSWRCTADVGGTLLCHGSAQ